jgi:hypothetical protein
MTGGTAARRTVESRRRALRAITTCASGNRAGVDRERLGGARCRLPGRGDGDGDGDGDRDRDRDRDRDGHGHGHE